MKALRCGSFGPPENLTLEDIDAPSAMENEAVVEVYAASLNFPDGLQIQGKYQFQPPMPFTPGSEVGGIIKSIGPELAGFEVGDRVMATPGLGGLAEEVVVKAQSLRKIPDSMDFKTAASFAMVYTTSYYALKQRANLAPGETLLVLGASGGVGLTAVELGKLMGAKVIAAASSDEKLAFVNQLQPEKLLNYGDGELKEKVKILTDGQGADVIYDPVGGSFSEPALRSIAWEGRFLVIGFAAGEIPKLPLNLALLKSCQIVGVFWGAWTMMFADENEKNFKELFDLHAAGKINPEISDRFSLEESAAAIAHLKDRKAKGKVIIDV